MKRTATVLIFAVMALVCFAPMVQAQDNSMGRYALHILDPAGPPLGCSFALTDCDEIYVEHDVVAGAYDILVLATNVEEIQFGRFGICCEGPISVTSWDGCADFEDPSPGWPGCGEGISVWGAGSAIGPYVTIGVLRVDVAGPSRISVCPDPRVGYASFCPTDVEGPDCFRFNDPNRFGSAGFGMIGFNPCHVGPPSGIEAIVRFDPRTLNLKSEGSYVSCSVELPEDYSTHDIDETTVLLNGIVPAVTGTPLGGGTKRDFKFDRAYVQALFCAAFSSTGASGMGLLGNGPPIGHGAEFALHVTGELYSGDAFSGRDTSRVIHQDNCGEASCEVSVENLDFGLVEMGDSAEQAFTITNTGDSPLIGFTSESCPDFEITHGGGGYLLDPGASQDVTVRFEPMTCGDKMCVVNAGLCGSVHCTGTVGPLFSCNLSPEAFDFGTIVPGGSSEERFRIVNTGCGPISGTIASPCPEFTIVSGASYNVNPGESHEVAVRFQSSTCGVIACTIPTDCGDLSCTGMVEGPACDVSPTSLDFGTVDLGDTAEETFTITNSGCTILDLNVSETCPEFLITSGDGAVTLLPGDAHSVTVSFSPSSCGNKTCTIMTGSSLCSDVTCSGQGGGGLCQVPGGIFDLGTVDVGSSTDLMFSIRNAGCENLSGTATEDCNDFAITSGASFIIPPGGDHWITVEFTPTVAGVQDCEINFPLTFCADVRVRGEGVVPGCDVVPTTLDFGSVDQGTEVLRTFTITNNGTSSISGVIEEQTPPCDSYEITMGGGSYTLDPGWSRPVTVRFNPTECDDITCTIKTGCADVTCQGTGTGSGCTVSPTTHDFGQVAVGSGVRQDITIENVGCTLLSLDINETCDHFDVEEGGGVQNLLPGETHTVVVEFEPVAIGVWSCFLNLGSPCTLVNLQGEGIAATNSLVVYPSHSTDGVMIGYRLVREGPVKLQVYDAAGRLVRTLVDGYRPEGDHNLSWDRRTDSGRQINAGIYFLKFRQGREVLLEKMIIAR